MRSRALVSSVLVVFGLALASRAAGADPPPSPISASPRATQTPQDEGRERFRRGIDLYREGNFRAALIEFQRAHEAAPSFRIQYNIGQTCLELVDYACALRAFERYRDGGDEVPKDRRVSVEKDIARLRKLVAFVRVKSDVDGAEVAVDDLVVGRTPLDAPLLVSAGRRRITVSKPPAPPTARVVDVAGGDAIDVVLDLAAGAPGTSTSPSEGRRTPVLPEPTPGPGPRTGQTAAWLGLTATAVVAAGAAVTGALALGAQSDLEAAAGADPGEPATIADARTRARTFATVTDVLLVSAVALGVGTVVLFARSRPGPPSAQSRVHLGVGVVAGTF